MERRYFGPEASADDKKFVFADVTHALTAKAKDVALEKSTESTEKPKGLLNRIKNFGSNVWKRSEVFQVLETYKAREEMLKGSQTGKENLFAHEQGRANREAHEKEMGATVNRFLSTKEYEDEFIQKAAGETREQLGQNPAEIAVKDRIQGLIRAFARGAINEEEFHSGKFQIFADIHGLKPESLDKGKMFANNLFEIAKQAKEEVRRQVEQRIDHEAAVQGLDLDFDVVIGRAKAGVRSEAQFNAIDRITDKIMSTTAGSILLNEKAVAVAVAAVNTFASKIVVGSVKRAATAFGVGVLVSGAAAAAKESRKLEVERMQHAREVAQGKQIEDEANSLRRKELKESRIQTRSVKELEGDLKSRLFDRLPGKEVKDLTESEFNEALKSVAEIEARLSISNRGIVKDKKTSKWQFWKSGDPQRVDLISYSDITRVEQERLTLLTAKAAARVELEKWAKAHGKDFKAVLNDQRIKEEIWLFVGKEGINRQNKVFHDLKKSKVKKAFAKGAFIGGAIGLAAQEIHAYFSSNREGVLEHGLNSFRGTHQPHLPNEEVTLGEGVRRYFLEEDRHTDFANLHDTPSPIGAHHFKLPDGYEMKPDGKGGFQLFDHGTSITESFKLEPDGSLTPEAKKYLEEHGFGPREDLTNFGPDKHIGGASGVLDLDQTKARFPGLDKHARMDWHDNPGQYYSDVHKKLIEFEGKQQNLFLEQAPDGTVSVNTKAVLLNLIDNLQNRVDDPSFGLNPDGTFDQKLIDLRNQMIQWSFEGKLVEHLQVAIIPTEAANKAGLSFLVDGVSSNKIPLPPEYSSFFTDPSMLKDGKLPFKFMELRIDGHVLATATGEDPSLIGQGDLVKGDIIPTTAIGKVTNPDDYITVPPYLLPYSRRKGLEKMKRVPPPPDEEDPDIVYGGAYGRPQAEMAKVYKERMSPTLKSNPEAVLNFENEYMWYQQNHIENDRGYANSLAELLNQEGMRERMNNECKAVACIPVYSLGEGKIIEHTLDEYRKQITNGSVKAEEFEIILFLNYPKDKLTQDILDKRAGAEARVAAGNPDPSDTAEVIKQYKLKHPEIKIRVMEKEFETRPQWGVIIKHLYDSVCARTNKRQGLADKDVLILTNDADVRDMSDKYLRSLIDDMVKNENEAAAGGAVRVDGLVGRIDHDNETYKKWPNFMLATRFDQFLDAQNRYGREGSQIKYEPGNGYVVINHITGEKQVITQGRNTALRASSYCAVGGARINKDAGADTELGDMVREGRRGVDAVLKKERNPFKYENKAWLETDPRRELGMYKQGKPIAWAWNDWDKMDVYGKSFSEQIDGDAEDLNIGRLEREFNQTLRKWVLDSDSEPVKRALTWLGLKTGDYSVENGEIKIIKTDNLKTKVDSWKPKRQRVEEAKANRARNKAEGRPLQKDLLDNFQREPLAYVYGGGLDSISNSGLSKEDFVDRLRLAYKISDGEFAAIKSEAALMKKGGASPQQKEIALIIKNAIEKNPSTIKVLKGSSSKDEYRKWFKDMELEDLRYDLMSGTLNDQLIDAVSSKYDMHPSEVMDAVISKNKSLKNEAGKRYRSATSVGGRRASIDTLAQVQRQVLREYQQNRQSRARTT